jgi:hypothetical protein
MLGVGDSLEVVPASPAAKSVVVGAGGAIVNGSPYYNDSSLALAVEDNTSGYTRVDRVALELDYVAKTVRAVVIKGPEDGSAEPAGLVQSSSYFQVPVARVTLASGYSTITEAEIADDRYFANLPGVLAPELVNGSGAEVDAGTVVVLDASANRSFDTSADEADTGVAGVSMERIPAAGSGKVATAGIVQVKVTGAVGRGDMLRQSGTAGAAQAGVSNSFAVALTENAGGDGIVWALLQRRNVAVSAQGFISSVSISSSWNSILLDTELHDTAEMFTPSSADFTVPVDGIYLVIAQTQLDRDGSNRTVAWRVRVNDVAVFSQTVYDIEHDFTPSRVSIAVELSAGDVVDCQFYSSAGPLTVRNTVVTVSLIGGT